MAATSPAKKYLFKIFNDELRCPICHEFLRDPMLTKECLHRFCARCIQLEVANGLRHCPECRLRLPNKVPFKSDPNFASIVNKLNTQRKSFARQDIMEAIRQHESARNLLEDDNKAQLSNQAESQKHPTDGDEGQSSSVDSSTKRHQPTASTLQNWAEKQRRNRDNGMPLILWPDASVYRDKALPRALRRSRYVYVPIETTVEHLSEYLMLRCELESNWRGKDKYHIEFARVEDERDDFTLLVHESNRVDYVVPAAGTAGECGNYTLKLQNNDETPTIMFSIAHPFRAIPLRLYIVDLLALASGCVPTNDHKTPHSAQRRLPKIVFRFVRKQI